MTLEAVKIFYKRYRNIIIAAVLLLLLIALAAFLYSTISEYLYNRKIEKLQQNVNIALTEADRLQANVNIDKQTADQIAANVNVAAREHLEAVNATDAQREATNAALERMNAARNANRNVNADELERILQELDK